VGAFARAHQRNPIRLLLDLAESNPEEALTALRTVPEARRHVDIFTNGASPQEYHHDRFVTSALGNFTARLAPYQAHIDTIAPPDLKRRDRIIPPEWAEQNGTVYLTYSLNDLRAAGGVVAAIVAAMLRYQARTEQGEAKPKLLMAIDELPAVGLRNISDYLATVGGYGVTLLLYVQSIAQLQELYGQQGTRAIISNCVHQLWYPAAEMETAKLMSELYGTTLKASPLQSATQGSRQQQGKDGQAYTQTSHNQGASWAWREGAALTPNEMMALPQGQVLVATQQERRQVFLGERLDPIPLFDRLPGPNGLGIPRPLVRERTYTDWTALAAALVGGGKSATNTPRQARDQAQPEAPPVVKADDEEAGANGSPVTQKLPAAKTQPAQTEPAATLLVDEETDKKMF
jgi:type IV secretory pathway TraG/TraD family ATPase VirD4